MRFLEHEDIKADPCARICENEFKVLFLCFCSLMCILHNKKLNLANIFLLLLKEKKAIDLYKQICEFDNDYAALKSFLEYDVTLHKSKYIKKYLNAKNGTTKKAKKKKVSKKK